MRILSHAHAGAGLVLLCSACGGGGGETGPTTPVVDRVIVTPTTFTLDIAGITTLQAAAVDRNGQPVAGQTVSWTSSSPEIATVSAAGDVTGVGPGPVTITASASGRSGNATGTVSTATMITSAGGTAWSADRRVRLIFPAGAVSAPTPISAVPATGLPASDWIVAGASYTFGPAGTQFAQPVQLTIGYGTLPAALADARALLWLHKLVNGEWVTQPGAPADTVAGTISGTVTRFSSLGPGLSPLAQALNIIQANLQVLATNATAQVALTIYTALAAVFQAQNSPDYQALAPVFLASVRLTVCNALSQATTTAQSTVVNNYELYTTVMSHLFYWAGQAELLRQFGYAPCSTSPSLDQLVTTKTAEFISFYLAKLPTAALPTSFPELVQEAELIDELRGTASQLGLDTYASRLEQEAQFPLLDEMRKAAYRDCRNAYLHDYLGQLRAAENGNSAIATYSEDDLIDDLQYCATNATWTARDADSAVVGQGTMGGGPNPGDITDRMAATVPADGHLRWTGTLRAFKCPNGTIEADELVVTLAGVEVERLTAPPNGNFLGTPLLLDLATSIHAAGIDPSQPGPYPLVLARESDGCNQYVAAPGSVETLLTLDLTLIAANLCADAPTDTLRTSHVNVIKKDGGTVNGSVLRSDWLDHSVTATATAPANLLSDEVSVFTESIDYLRFVPGDPSLLNTPATLRFRVTGLVEVTGEQKTFSSAWAQVHIRASWAHFKTWVIDTWASASEPQSITIDEVIQAPIVLGHWERSWPEVAVTVKARNGQTSTAKARFVYTPPLEVRNAAGQVVPLARICTASGKVY